MSSPDTILVFAVIMIALYFIGYAFLGLVSGRTRGYYRNHLYVRTEDPSAYWRWVFLRLFLGIFMLLIGMLVLS